MSGKGAPTGNQFAKKEQPGRTIGLYIAATEWKKLHADLEAKKQDTSDKAVSQYARQLFKEAVRKIEIENE